MPKTKSSHKCTAIQLHSDIRHEERRFLQGRLGYERGKELAEAFHAMLNAHVNGPVSDVVSLKALAAMSVLCSPEPHPLTPYFQKIESLYSEAHCRFPRYGPFVDFDSVRAELRFGASNEELAHAIRRADWIFRANVRSEFRDHYYPAGPLTYPIYNFFVVLPHAEKRRYWLSGYEPISLSSTPRGGWRRWNPLGYWRKYDGGKIILSTGRNPGESDPVGALRKGLLECPIDLGQDALRLGYHNFASRFEPIGLLADLKCAPHVYLGVGNVYDDIAIAYGLACHEVVRSWYVFLQQNRTGSRSLIRAIKNWLVEPIETRRQEAILACDLEQARLRPGKTTTRREDPPGFVWRGGLPRDSRWRRESDKKNPQPSTVQAWVNKARTAGKIRQREDGKDCIAEDFLVAKLWGPWSKKGPGS